MFVLQNETRNFQYKREREKMFVSWKINIKLLKIKIAKLCNKAPYIYYTYIYCNIFIYILYILYIYIYIYIL